jgi:hypothetical protein
MLINLTTRDHSLCYECSLTFYTCHGKYGSAPLSGVTDPYSRSLYIGRFLPTNLQLMEERQKHSTFATIPRVYHHSILFVHPNSCYSTHGHPTLIGNREFHDCFEREGYELQVDFAERGQGQVPSFWQLRTLTSYIPCEWSVTCRDSC